MFLEKINELITFMLTPGVCWVAFVIFLISYITYIAIQGGFDAKEDNKIGPDIQKETSFLHFGPEVSLTFFGMPLDTWGRVISVYIIGFLSIFFSEYFKLVMKDKLNTKIWNPAFKTSIGISKLWVYIISITEPILWWSFDIITFALFLLRKLQFLIPILLGKMAFNIPYVVMKLKTKKF
jgi:hypothetical protein